MTTKPPTPQDVLSPEATALEQNPSASPVQPSGASCDSSATASQPYTASNRIMHLWAIGSIADYMLFVSFQALIKPIFTTAFGLSPVLVGWALMLPRILDAVTDPLLGYLSDNTHTRWGRRRPFLFGSSIVGALMVAVLWWASPNWSQHTQFAYLLGASFTLYLCYGTYSMTHTALGYELSDDYHLRTKVVAVRSFYFSVAALAGGWLYWLALRPVFGGEINGIRWISVGMAAAILIAGNIPVLTTRERFENPRRGHANLWNAIRTTLKVRPFVFVLALRFAQTLGLSLYSQMAFFIGVYSVCRGDKSLYSTLTGIVGIVGFIASFALVPCAAKLSRSLGKRPGIIIGYGFAFLGSSILPFFARPGHPYLLLAHMLVFAVAMLPLTVFLQAIMPDICDIDELHSGERREGLFSAVIGFVNKIENSLCILLGGYLLTYCGFSTVIAQNHGAQPQEVLDKLRFFGFAPAIVFSGIAFAISIFLPINHKLMEDVRAKLDARHREKAR